MLKQCKYCGKQYNGDPGSSACPECADARRHTTVADRICRSCGIVFPGGPRAWYCPDCRAERKSRQSREYRERQVHGAVRKIGSSDICVICGKPYTVNSGLQRYCPDCAPDAVAEIDREQSRRWNADNTSPEDRRDTRNSATVPIECVICGKQFIPHNASVTCSAECSAELSRQNAAAYERNNKAARNEYHRKLRAEKLEAMSVAELSDYRSRINAKARENYKKRRDEK